MSSRATQQSDARKARQANYIRMLWRDFARSKLAVLALAVLVAIMLGALAAPWITPQNPYDQALLNLADARLVPGSTGSGGYVHMLGTDADGRDLYSAIVYGVRLSLGIGLVAGVVALVAGTLLGLLAALRGGLVEAAIMRVVDLQLSFPPLMLALVLVAALGQGRFQVIVALVAAQYAYFARTVHGAALAERQKEYIEAAAAIPLPPLRIALGHLLPNVFPPLIVVGTIHIASTIVLEATLSFLGVGLPMTEPSLGSLILRGFEYMQSGRIWMSVYPGATLVVIMLAINLVGDQLREVLNPRLKQ
ncbi:ABC transporter permease [Verminephrobacter eiseniae]|uniref:Binding-protein-dependent transport systems inner membrane component n=1 Tax=Verminephrobacter eiseniae (strain EF01-2) TaxID=391735 RepID=A1WPP5_VEREI|nr:ABC transporter permease [Verminephrobacter eiseniae]ABM59602.1 binding-protein-dependent transport systems inner membrane component [Verminephrobacter eiseniae EF01-2]MCW5285117.1 ABC transporter permease [Verminephrobacter eiseniae]MCW5302825.1 ABC transporter permease [Verminephrobacter eiseniae]MCW8180485.1 ABC transporter permease [Verminephrobacter eiseniae]MCW8191448.1 ABC transporter permease [Verminephrobacter eiseniae]